MLYLFYTIYARQPSICLSKLLVLLESVAGHVTMQLAVQCVQATPTCHTPIPQNGRCLFFFVFLKERTLVNRLASGENIFCRLPCSSRQINTKKCTPTRIDQVVRFVGRSANPAGDDPRFLRWCIRRMITNKALNYGSCHMNGLINW